MARPSEIKAVAAAISQPAASAEEAAKLAIQALDKSREDRTEYLIVRQIGVMADAYGPYATVNQAERAIEGGKIPAIDGSRFFIIPLRHPSHAEAAWARADDGGVGEQARKMWQIARNGGMQAKQSTRRRRRTA